MARSDATSKAGARTKQSRLLSEPAAIMTPRLLFIFSVAALCVIGLVMVYSASSIAGYNEHGDTMYFIKRQAVFMVVGVVLCVILSRIPYTFWATPAVFVTLWALTVGLLFLTAFGMGVTALGAERSIIIAGFALQPAEFAKITVLMAAASIIQMRLDGRIEGKRFIVIILIATIVPLIFIYRQPDLGTAIILAVGFIALALLAGISWKIVAAIIGVLIAYVVFACVTQPYHFQRIVSMFNPWLDPQGDGYQSIQSLYAFGSGGFFGTGLGLSRQKYLYLPYAHTDFIFAIVGEELGFLGALCVIALFGLFIYSGMRISRMAPDMLGCMLAGSFTVVIGFQACVNMACVTGIAPVTGKALPLISYGGSSMVATLMMIGIILSVSFRSKVGMSYERKRDNFLVIDGSAPVPPPQGSKRGSTGNVIAMDDARGKKRQEKRDRTARTRSRGSQGRDRDTGRTLPDGFGSSGRLRGNPDSGEPKGYAALKPKRGPKGRR